jgi:hypothetical protein
VTFELHDMLGDDNWAVVDWADAPEVHDKVIFQNVDTCFHVLLAGGGGRQLCWALQEVQLLR